MGLLQECKAGSIFNTQCNTVVSTGYGGGEIRWSYQLMQTKHLTKSNTYHNNKDLSKVIEGNYKFDEETMKTT